MRHPDIRDISLQREVGLENVIVNKVAGHRNPADLMTKFLKRWEIEMRLKLMGIRVKWSDDSNSYKDDRPTPPSYQLSVGDLVSYIARPVRDESS